MDTVVHGVNALGEFFLLSLDKNIYSKEAIMKTCYAFTDDYFIHAIKVSDERVGVFFYNKSEDRDVQDINMAVRRFLQTLQENEMRQIILQETKTLHEEIVRKAFSPATWLIEGEEQRDPLNILTSAV
ncbi:His-Xaa-Ser system protein HxsD [Scandinavium goeteborgense]|nr:His-Xaa-Ser system protein HxsD [Scandinavium goeteborgense]